MRPHSEPGIRRDANGRIRAYVRANGRLRFKRFPAGTLMDAVCRWRMDTRVSLQTDQVRGRDARRRHRTLPATDRGPAAAGRRTPQTAGMVGSSPRPPSAPTPSRPPMSEPRSPTCAGRARRRRAITTVRRSSPYTRTSTGATPRIRCGMSRRFRPRHRNRAGSGTTPSSASSRPCRIRATRPSRVARASTDPRRRPRVGVHGHAAQRVDARPARAPGPATQTLVVLTGKGGRTRTIPLRAPAVEALEELESLGALGPFSTSAVRRAFVRAAERLGIHGVRPCDLRH